MKDKVNKVCASCIEDCKQPEFMEVVNCPKYKRTEKKEKGGTKK